MNRDSHSALRAEIEPLEAWLGERMRQHPEPECRSIDVAKHRVHLALGEPSTATGPSPEVLERIKRAVRCELEKTTTAGALARGAATDRLIRIGLAGMAVAALLTFVVAIWQTRGPAATLTLGEADLEDFVEVVTGTGAELDLEFANLESELDAFAESLAMNDDMFDDTVFDELGDDLDVLLAEIEESLGA